MIYGELPYHVDDDSTDKVGLRTLVLGKRWQASRSDLSLAERDAETPPPPEMPGGVLLVGRQTQRGGGGLRTQWVFEGVDGDGKSVTFRQRHNTNDFGFDPGFEQVSAQLHPKIQLLMDTYGGVLDPEGNIFWPPTIGSGTAGGGFGLGPGNSLLNSGTETPNPLFGFRDWQRITGTYFCRYLSFSKPTIEAGRIFNAGGLPGDAPSFPGRDYLSAGAPYRKRGPVYDITELFWLSGPGGWIRPIYGSGSQK